MQALVVFSIFCFFALELDEEGLAKSEITIPMVNIPMSLSDFLLFGPIGLIDILVYLHIFIGHFVALATEDDRSVLPYIFNMPSRLSRLITGLLFYWLPILILVKFVSTAGQAFEKRLADAEQYVLGLAGLTVFTAVILWWLQIRRWPRAHRRSFGYLATWALLLALVVASSLVGWQKLPAPRDFQIIAGRFEDQTKAWLVTSLPAFLGESPTDTPADEVPGSRKLALAEQTTQVPIASGDNGEDDLNTDAADGQGTVEQSSIEYRWDLGNADLSNQSLVGRDFAEADLRGANLSGSDLSGADFYAADLSGAQLERTNLTGVDFFDANLTGANLKNARLNDADISFANLSGADLTGASLSGADLYWVKLENAKFDPNEIRKAISWFLAFYDKEDREVLELPDTHNDDLDREDFTTHKLANMNLAFAYFNDFNLSAVDLSNSDLSFASLRSANLEGANLTNVKFNGTNLLWANLRGATFQPNMLQAADHWNLAFYSEDKLRALSLAADHNERLRNKNFEGMDLSGAYLWGFDFSSANLKDANLRNATLRWADFQHATLTGADLEGSSLHSADLGTATGVTQEQLDRSCGNDDTILPKGMTIPTSCPGDK